MSEDVEPVRLACTSSFGNGLTSGSHGRDGAIVVGPLSNDAHYLLFRFPNRTF